MYIDPLLLPRYLLYLSAVATLSGLLLAARAAPWGALYRVPQRMHLLAGGAVCCLLLWLLSIRFDDGLLVHLTGMAALTMVLGVSLALLAGAAAALGLALFKGLSPAGLPLAWLLSVLVPVLVTHLLVQWLRRCPLRNPVVYILGAGFFGAALGVLLIALCAVGVFWLAGLQTWLEAARQSWPLLLLLMFSEGFVNGTCAAALVTFQPDWLRAYDEAFFLGD